MTNHARKPIIVVQGGQFGSEAKGSVAAALCLQRNTDFAIRTGAINAGHTVVYKGVRHAMQQIPTGWVNPHTALVIGAGAYIHPPTLFREIELINEAMPDRKVQDRLFIDFRCGVHDEEAENASKTANRHHSIGATGKGCSEAIVNKIRNRNNGAVLFREWLKVNFHGKATGLNFVDTVNLLNRAHDDGKRLLIEGTQGTLLDLHLGPYPYTTSRMTSAANWVAECGLSPSLPYEVVLVVRTFPIRVAGNSGPMANEIEWTKLARDINGKLSAAGKPGLVSNFALAEFESKLEYAASEAVISGKYHMPTVGRQFKVELSKWTPEERNQFRAAASELHRDALNLCKPETVVELRKLFEMTTVTKKLRRLAEVSFDDLRFAIDVNRPSWIALTFMDYLVPELAGVTDAMLLAAPPDYSAWVPATRAWTYATSMAEQLGVSVKYISTGPEPDNFIPVSHLRQEQSQR